MPSEKEIEKELQDKGLNAPRLTPQLIDKSISYSEYFRVNNTTVTICAIVLKNGFTVIGESAAVSMDNFDEAMGKKIAFDNARDKIWALEGYLLKQKLFEES